MILILPSQALVLNAYAVLVGSKPGNAALKEHQAFINTAGVGEAGYKAALESFASGSFTTASMATAMLTNLGLSAAFTQAQAEAYLNANPGNRVGAMMSLGGQLYSYTGTDATLLAAKAAYVAKINDSYTYSNNTANVNGQEFAGTGAQTYTLTTGLDNFVGTAGNDSFLARSINSTNTFQDGDMLDGGAGTDVVYLDFVGFTNAITPNLKNIESVVIRAQSASVDGNGVDANDGNNMPNDRKVQIDAQRSLATDLANKVTADLGVTNWESSNSRSDVVIEDVRIGNTQKTKDITITFRESDPGNVDFGVYFDQHSLRNASSGNTTVTIKLMDTGAAGAAATAATPLLNNPYDQFKIGINGVLTPIQLDTVAVAAADTYAALLAVFQAALVGTTTTASLGATFQVIDPISGTTVTGTSIVLTGGAGAAITEVAGSGWFNTTGASVPATSNIYTTYTTAASSVTELVTSTIVLDDVGRGSNGGDLVVGGMSTGDTSTSRGVERFEITVQDSSKLQTINSTDNALREVTIVNGTTSNSTTAYNTVVTNAGDLTVNGRLAVGGDVVLPGVENGSAVGVHDDKGFTDVRLIDGSAMTGKLAFTADITSDSLAKYVNLTDTATSPTADVAGAGNTNFNVRGANFLYTGGGNNDTMTVTIDSAVAASTTLTGQSDFTIVIDGGAGNDTITTNIGGNETAAWLIDQRQNANVRIEGGAGNDTITSTGAGDAIINAGAGTDTVFADNSGTKTTTWLVNATNTVSADLSTAAATSTFLYGGKLTVSFSGAGGTGLGGGVTAAAADSVATSFTNGYEVVVDIPTGANFGVTQLHMNQAIKNAINNDAVLSKLLGAADGPAGTLTITTKIDGAFNANDLSMTVTTPTLTAAEEAAALTALKAFAKDSSLVTGAAQTANNASVVTLNAITGMSAGGAGAGSILANAVAAVAEVQTIDFTGVTAAASGNFTIGGVTVAVLVGDTTQEIADKVVAAFNLEAPATAIGDATATNVLGTSPVVTLSFTAAYGNVAPTFIANGTANLSAVPGTTTTVPGVTAAAGATGTISAAESDNTIDMGAGGDVLVLGTGALSNDKVVFTGADIGTNAIVNFQDGAGANADMLDFKSYLTSMKASNLTSTSTDSQIRIATTLNGDTTVEANSVTVISGVTYSVTETFAGLTGANLLAAINSTNVASAADWGTAGLAAATLNALTTYTSTAGANYLVSGAGKAIVMVENTANEGEYKVFELSFNGIAASNATADFTAATLLGTVDFGNQLTLLVGNLA